MTHSRQSGSARPSANGNGAHSPGAPNTNGHGANGNGAATNGNGAHALETQHGPEDPHSVLDLVERCRGGDEAAWRELHARCHANVLKQIRYTLGAQARDHNLVEEIAARVWFGLVSDDRNLLERFQPKKGNGLENYLAAIARFEVLRHLRSEYRRRRREHETQSMRKSERDDRLLREMALDVKDFLPQLTPREKEFFHHVLMGNNGHHLRISAPNAWQLRHRIRKKLLEFLEKD